MEIKPHQIKSVASLAPYWALHDRDKIIYLPTKYKVCCLQFAKAEKLQLAVHSLCSRAGGMNEMHLMIMMWPGW